MNKYVDHEWISEFMNEVWINAWMLEWGKDECMNEVWMN